MAMPESVQAPNALFRGARQRYFGSRQALADAVNLIVPEAYRVSDNDIGKVERGQVTWPRLPRRVAYRTLLNAATDEALGFYDRRAQQPAGVASSSVTLVAGRTFAADNSESGRSDESWGLQPRRCSPAAVEPAQNRGETGGVIRRTVLLALAAAGGAALGAVEPSTPAANESRHLITADVAHWQETAWEYGYDYHLASRERLLADIGKDQDAVRQQLMGHLAAAQSEAQPVAAVAAQLTSLMALICTDLGFSREARHLWRFARGYADISSDSTVRQWVSGQEITSGIYQQRPLPVLAELARQALERNVNSPASAGKAELLGGQAQVLALLGDIRGAQLALRELHETYARLPSGVMNLRDSYFGWSEHRLHHATSFTHSMTGATGEATAAQDSALRLYPKTRTIARCQIHLHRARCLIIDGDTSDGLSHASHALVGIEVARRKQFVLAVADHVLEAVPATERARPEARELEDLLHESRPPVKL
jgi:hypothetical protein